jgi:hypothetical protein
LRWQRSSCAARRWPDYLAIAVLTAALVRPTAQHVTDDISRYLPDTIWSGGSDKEQFIYTSAASTILLPLIVSAVAVYVFKQAWHALQSARKRSDS